MLIRELAAKTGLTPQTIRFYEKEGFLDKRHIQRRENNYREYSEGAVEQLRYLKAGQIAGFTLAELKNFREESVTTHEQVAFLHQKLHDIGWQIAEMERIRNHLTELLHTKENGLACPYVRAHST